MDSCLIVCKRLLESLGVPFTREFLKEKILTHPHHPSLLSLSDTLEEYGVESLAVKLTPDRLDDFPLPGIVQVSMPKGFSFNVITGVSEHSVSLIDENGNQDDTSRLDFLKSWTGVSLLVEAGENAAEPEIEKKNRDQRILKGVVTIFVVSFLVWLGSSLAENGFLELPLTYFLLKSLGLSISGILIWYQQDKVNPVLKKFCSGGKSVDCDSVLDSKEFQALDGRINPSLLAFSYFFSGLGMLLISGLSSMPVLGWLSIASIPVVIYSLYYQAVVIKKWCRFCLMIQGVLVLEVLSILREGFLLQEFSPSSIWLFLFLFSAIVLGGVSIKPMLGRQDELYKIKRELAKFKRNKHLFQTVLLQSNKILNDPHGIGIILKGKTSKHKVIKVCDPYCGPCSKVHPVLESLYDKGNIDLQILFTPSRGDERKEKIIRHFLAVAGKNEIQQTRQVLDEWYGSEEKDHSLFSLEYPLNEDLDLENEKIKLMEEWCKEQQITFTPTLFINGHQLPENYNAEDLIHILD